MKIKYFSFKGGRGGGGGVQSETPKPPLNQPLIPVWFSDFWLYMGKAWSKHAAYDLFIMRTLMGF